MIKSRTSLCLLAGVLILALSSLAAAPRGSIRGFVYQDVDGDGRCRYEPAGPDQPVSDTTLIFASSENLLQLYTGSDGSYGLVAVGQGAWQVRVAPGAGRWSLLSANPVDLSIAATGRLVHTDVNFCLRSLGPAASTAAAAGSPADFSAAVTLLRADAAASGESLPEADANALLSEAILTFVPASEPPANLDAIAAEPVGANATPPAEWLTYLNQFREMAGLAALTEMAELTQGSQAHARYMVVNDKPIAHSQNAANPLFSEAGLQAAQNGNIFATTQANASFEWAINFWISAPFHLLPIIDPALDQVGYGDYAEAVGNFHMAAVLDAGSLVGTPPADQSYPIYFPGGGSETRIVRHSLYEWPDPVDSCPGYTRPTGPPLIVQVGDGSLEPQLASYSVTVAGLGVPACAFSETSYTNPDQYAQDNGRSILGERDAIVVMPRHPLSAGKTYTVMVVADGQTYSWSFRTAE